MLWRIGDWGPACGPAPSGGSEAGGSVTVEDDGKVLTLRGLGRTYRSDQCWEKLPGLITKSSGAGGSTRRTVCKSAPGDPRQTTLTTTWTIRPDALYFDEAGQYQFVVEGQNCTASVRRTRVIRRAAEPAREPASASPSAVLPSAPEVTPPPTPSAVPARKPCAHPGPARRLEVTPAQKLMLPGEKFTFRSVVRDASGCVLSTHPQWSIRRGEELGQLVGPGTLEATAGAADGTLELRATLDGKFVDVSALIVSKDRYEALLAGGSYRETGESKESAVTTLAGATIDADAQVIQKPQSRLPWVVLGLAATLVAVAAAWFGLGRKRAPARPEQPPEAPPPPSAAPPPEKICPVCGEVYPPTHEFCGRDGAQLLRMN